MNIAERPLSLVLQLAFIRRIRREPDAQIVSAASFQIPEGRHRPYSFRSGRGRSADHIPLLLRSESDEVDRITGHTNGELRVLVRVLHRVFERLLVDDV